MPADFELTAECLACILRQVLEACEEASKDTRLRYQAVRDAVMSLNAWESVLVSVSKYRI
jgi:uncharacterized protein with ATP-grasp and redox domains